MHVLILITQILLFSCLFFSCAKTKYLFEQGYGQFSILYNAKPNEKVLMDENIPEKNKNKIRLVKDYTKYFYNFFNIEKTKIYSKTTILKSEAVCYMVVASKYDVVEAKKEYFPFVGHFPYLGFFKLDSTKKHVESLEKDNYITWITPIYAYSTLGYFTDTILSSFFVFDDYQLAEIIFHELIHTVLFIKDEVEFNENMANFFGRKMSKIYFQLDEKNWRKKEQIKENNILLKIKIAELVKELNRRYKKKKNADRSVYTEILNEFINKKFIPEIKNLCEKQKINQKRCFPLHMKWNNAAFASFLTYERESTRFANHHKKLGISLNEYLHYIIKKHKEYETIEPESGFANFLFENHAAISSK